MDVTRIPVRKDGWAHLAAVIDCHDRAVAGYKFALRGRAGKPSGRSRRPAWRASGPCGGRARRRRVRSDNGLIFESRRFRRACKDYVVRQEFTTPYTPEQNGFMVVSFLYFGNPSLLELFNLLRPPVLNVFAAART